MAPTEEPRSAERLKRNGWIATGVWVLVVVALVVWRADDFCTMSLNAWGDFFAGAVAPLAFLWLVLGYFQQGEEIRQNTRETAKLAIAAKDTAAGIVNANIPYLAPELHGAAPSTTEAPSRPTVYYAFRNYGSSPATIVDFSDYLVRLESLPEQPIYPPRELEQDREMVVGANGQSRVVPCGLVVGINAWEELLLTQAEILADPRPYFLVGRVIYDDAFGLRHTKRYCYRFWVSGNVWRSRPDGGKRYNLRTIGKSPYSQGD